MAKKTKKVQQTKVESKKAPAKQTAKRAPAGGRRAQAASESDRQTQAGVPVAQAASLVPAAEAPPAATAGTAPGGALASSAAPAGEPAPASTVTEPATSATTEKERDPRLPPPGTVLQKKNRQGEVRCECVVTDDGFVYKGVVHRSLSAAAVAAGKDLGLTGALNGYAFWGLSKPRAGVPRKGRDPVKSLEKAFARYRVRLNALLSDDTPEEARAGLLAAVKAQAETLLRVGGREAS